MELELGGEDRQQELDLERLLSSKEDDSHLTRWRNSVQTALYNTLRLMSKYVAYWD